VLADAVEHPRADTYAPDLSIRVLGEEALRRSESVVGNDIGASIDIDGYDLSLVGWFDLTSDLSFV